MLRAIALLTLIAIAAPLGGCVYEGPGGPGRGWCYYHPYRCR